MNELDPWAQSSVEDYEKLIKDFGMQPMDEFKSGYSDLRYIRRNVIFGHRDFSRIDESIQKKKRFALMTGLMPSGRFHFGHKMVADEIIWFQRKGAEIFSCAADMESYLMRGVSFEDARKTATEEYLANYIALGLNPDKLTFWFQSDYRNEYYRLRDMLSKKVTFNELKAIYGELTTGKIISALTQAADILHPQLPEFGGPRPVVVPVGADQDPHIRLTRDLAQRFNEEFKFVPPSATYHKFMSGLQGGKMSSSNPQSFIALTDEPKEAAKKVMRAKTGGRATVEEQKKLGGIPEQCMIYELYLYHLIDDDKALKEIHQKCKAGTLMCGEDKKHCAQLMEKFLSEHQKKRAEAKKQAEKLLKKR
ncbi:MAG: tryptophan--tRNA ligase [Candidatus Altiarchaeota archaeon]|nr:tryptophan--tRNA ligase [Candidatus Altiarchaeota archaeon]